MMNLDLLLVVIGGLFVIVTCRWSSRS